MFCTRTKNATLNRSNQTTAHWNNRRRNDWPGKRPHTQFLWLTSLLFSLDGKYFGERKTTARFLYVLIAFMAILWKATENPKYIIYKSDRVLIRTKRLISNEWAQESVRVCVCVHIRFPHSVPFWRSYQKFFSRISQSNSVRSTNII